MHARDIIDSFIEHSISDSKCFQWTRHLRFHWFRDEDNLYIVHCSGKIPNRTNNFPMKWFKAFR